MSGPGKRGASSKLTPERLAKIIEAVKFGVPAHKASTATGISERVHFLWLKKGRELLSMYENDIDQVPKDHDDYMHAYYATQLEQAQAESESRLVLLISQEAKKTWTAAAWMLERRWPETYGRRDKLDANVNGNLGLTFAESLTEAAKRRKEQFDERRRQAEQGEDSGD